MHNQKKFGTDQLLARPSVLVRNKNVTNFVMGSDAWFRTSWCRFVVWSLRFDMWTSPTEDAVDIRALFVIENRCNKFRNKKRNKFVTFFVTDFPSLILSTKSIRFVQIRLMLCSYTSIPNWEQLCGSERLFSTPFCWVSATSVHFGLATALRTYKVQTSRLRKIFSISVQEYHHFRENTDSEVRRTSKRCSGEQFHCNKS